MKLLFAKLLLFTGGILLFALALSLIPPGAFTFRTWESMVWLTRVMKPTIGEFYPGRTSIRDEAGDLGRNSRYERIKRDIVWKTDKYGFRNDPDGSRQYPVLLVGDSNVAGSGTSQEFILSSQLRSKINLPVYTYAPLEINWYFLDDLKAMNIRPETVIYLRIERGLRAMRCYPLNDRRHLFISAVKSKLRKVLDVNAFMSLEIAVDRFRKKEPVRYLQGRIDSFFGAFGLPVVIGAENVLFAAGSAPDNSPAKALEDKEIGEIADTIKNISGRINDSGMEFIFVPIPDKESVYYELLPEEYRKNFKNRDFLVKLKKELDLRGVRSIDLYSSFRSHFLAGERFYFSDDTHWNRAGIALASEMIIPELSRKIIH